MRITNKQGLPAATWRPLIVRQQNKNLPDHLAQRYEKMEERNIDIKFKGIDDWNRPVYKVVDKNIFFGSVNKLFNYNASDTEVNEYFRSNLEELEFFGDHFGCEPHGGRASNWVFNIV